MIVKGQYINDLPEGIGLYVYLNGDKYEGNFDNDIENGEGKLTKQNGEVITGVWIIPKSSRDSTRWLKNLGQ